MRRHWLSITVITSLATVAFGRSPNPEIPRGGRTAPENRIRAGDCRGAGARRRGVTAYAFSGKAFFIDGQHKQAVVNLEKAIGQDSVNSEYYDWLGRAYGRLALGSSLVSAFGHARKTVRAFERAVELNLEALSDVFEYYLQTPAIVGGGWTRLRILPGVSRAWMRRNLTGRLPG